MNSIGFLTKDRSGTARSSLVSYVVKSGWAKAFDFGHRSAKLVSGPEMPPDSTAMRKVYSPIAAATLRITTAPHSRGVSHSAFDPSDRARKIRVCCIFETLGATFDRPGSQRERARFRARVWPHPGRLTFGVFSTAVQLFPHRGGAFHAHY